MMALCLLMNLNLGVVNCWDAGISEIGFISAMAMEGEVAAGVGAGAAVGGAGAAASSGWTVGNTVSAAGTLISAAGTAASLLTKPPVMPSGQIAETKTDTTEAAAYAAAENLKRRRGAASTVLTGPMGVQSPGQTMKSTLGN